MRLDIIFFQKFSYRNKKKNSIDIDALIKKKSKKSSNKINSEFRNNYKNYQYDYEEDF